MAVLDVLAAISTELEISEEALRRNDEERNQLLAHIQILQKHLDLEKQTQESRLKLAEQFNLHSDKERAALYAKERPLCTYNSDSKPAPEEVKRKFINRRPKAHLHKLEFNAHICYKTAGAPDSKLYEVYIGFKADPNSSKLSQAWKSWILEKKLATKVSSDRTRLKSHSYPASPASTLGEEFLTGHQLTLQGSSHQKLSLLADLDFTKFPSEQAPSLVDYKTGDKVKIVAPEPFNSELKDRIAEIVDVNLVRKQLEIRLPREKGTIKVRPAELAKI